MDLQRHISFSFGDINGGANESQDELLSITEMPPENYYDFHVPVFENYFAAGFWHHNCGKTARVHAAFDAAKIPLTVWRASLMERVDVSGCIVPDMESGVSRQLPFADVQKLNSSRDKVGLFIDDLGQAPTDVQAGLMRLFEREAFGDNVILWAATNRPGDKAGVTALCEPLRSRFAAAYVVPTPGVEDKADGGVLLGNWQDEAAGWMEWAMDAGAAPEIIAWHRSTAGAKLYQWKPSADPSLRFADYRAWGSIITRWEKGMRSLPQIAGVIGKAAAAEFLAFAAMADKLPSPDQVWMDPLGAPVPDEPSAQFLITTTLGMQVGASTAPAFIKYIARLPRVMAALGARDAYRRLGAKLSGCREWVKWFTENQQLFAA